jgi:predicted nucleotidyltransferase
MFLANKIHSDKGGFQEICTNHGVKEIYAFGSSIGNEFNEETSDVDLIVLLDEKDPLIKGEKLLSIWDKLEDFFKRKVDILSDSKINNPFLRKSIDSTKILIYDGSKQKILI